MKRLFAAWLGCALLLAAGCARETADALPPLPEFPPADVATVCIALAERPDARRVLLLGERAKRLSGYFSRAGVEPVFALAGDFPLIVVACSRMSREAEAKVAAHLAEGGVLAWMLDMRKSTVAEFRDRIREFAFPEFRLWMTGEERWLLTGRTVPAKIRLAAAMETFVREEAFADQALGKCGSIQELFANYAGGRAEIAPAFGFLDPEAELCADNFVTRDVPPPDWISTDGLDEDIARGLLAEIRSMQVVRRQVLEGNRLALAAVDKKGEEAATDVWARAALRNPHDVFLLERLERLERNAKGFLAVGKVLPAMKCYETMVLIRPDDPSAVHNFGTCLRKLGRQDMAEKVLARARKLKEEAEWADRR